MTIDEKKAWLCSYRADWRIYRALLQERGQWLDAATHITPTYSDMPKGESGDKIQRAVDKLAEIDTQIFAQLEKLEQRRRDIVASIDALTDTRYREVLHYRYINGDSWELIAVTMSYDFRWVTRLHSEALKAIKPQKAP